AAADGLTLHLDSRQPWRGAWGEHDWLGPISMRVHDAIAGGRRTEAFQGSDDRGAYCGIDVSWKSIRWPLHTPRRAYTELPLLVFRIAAEGSISDLATGTFARPSVAWPHCLPTRRASGGVPEGTRSYGHQYTEFALPVTGDARCTGFAFAPHRPPVVEPLLMIARDGRTLLLAPLDHFHEQIIAVPADAEHADEGVCCGWQGDLADI